MEIKKDDLVLSIETANDLAAHVWLDTYFCWIAGEDMSGERIIKTSAYKKGYENQDIYIPCPAPTMAEIVSILPESVCIENYRYSIQHYRFDGMFISEIGDTEGSNGQWEGFADEKKPVDPCGKLAVWLLDNGYKEKLTLNQ